MTKALHISLAQINPIVGDLPYNKRKIQEALKKAPTSDLVIFPELALCGYPPEDLVLKPFFLAQVDKALSELAGESQNYEAWFVVGAPFSEEGKVYNAAFLIGDGKIQAVTRKHFLPNYGVFDEMRVFQSAPPADPVTFRGHKLGVIICEDLWRPEIAAHMKKKGAELLISINASPYEEEKRDARLKVARNRVKETNLPLIYVNQAGGQDELVFDGASFVLNENGDLLFQAEEFIEEIQETVWEKATKSAHWLCSTSIINPAHEGPEAIYQAVMTGLRDYVTKNGFSGVLIGLSGGIDSALTAAIAVDALGPAAVHGITMPSRFTSQASLEDAKDLADNLQIRLENIPIEKPFTAFHDLLEPHFNQQTPATTYENIQSRTRGMILMALSNATGYMVLSTGNKSEMAVGYATLYGDLCGGYNVLKDLYKTQVYQMARWRNRKKPDHGLGFEIAVIPERTITRPPSAELREDQTDEDSLPPYDVLDDILYCLIERDMSVEDIARRGHDRDLIKEVWAMLDRAEYKRRQAPPGIKITSRSFGRDRRYPITNHFQSGLNDDT